MKAAALGIDVGGGRVRVGLVNEDGVVLGIVERATPGSAAELAGVLAGCCDALGRQTGMDVRGVAAGIAIPGAWDRVSGIMRRAVNLPYLDGVNIRELFERTFGRAVLIESDSNAAGWGQWMARIAAGQPSDRDGREGGDSVVQRYVYLSIGTGIGGCGVLNGEIVRHTRGGPGHLGHLMVDTRVGAPHCRCGARGCAVAVAGGWAMEEWKRRNGAGDRSLKRFEARAASGLAVLCCQIAVLYAPDVIALGGGVVEHWPAVVAKVRGGLDAVRGTLVSGELRIERAGLKSGEAGVVGAGLMALGQGRKA